jgi:hypothetical protein
MITLEAAIAELEAMEDPMEALKKYPNSNFPGIICLCCPVAAFLSEKVGEPVWVGTEGATLKHERFSRRIFFSNKLQAVIADLDRYNARHSA